MRRRRAPFSAAIALILLVLDFDVMTARQPASSPPDPLPQSVDELLATGRRVLEETGVPGAGLALIRSDGVEWEGGIGFADRSARTPVTADTRFRVGSISKSFVALALVQLYEDSLVDLDTPVREIAPEIDIDNAWEDTHPVQIIHVLQHTAGFDDMHFNEMVVPPGEGERSLEQVLALNPRSRRVRWQPGTRMSYSNPGYAVAARLIEKIAGQPYEDYVHREIFDPLRMTNSSFRLTPADEPLLARGYVAPGGPPLEVRRIYLRPSGNMYSTAHDLARFVQMLLGWGELGSAFVVDPEYLGNMEQPRTTLASDAGLRHGYGSGMFMRLDLPYKLLGHDGQIDGFTSWYGYSPSRDVGVVVLLNSSGARAGEALKRLTSLAIRYLKRDVEPPQPPEITLATTTLDAYEGYYHDANPRNQFVWPMQTLLAGRTIVRDGDHLYADPVIGSRVRLVPVTDSTFRLEHELDASRVFTRDADDVMVMAGAQLYAERVPRWRIELVRMPVLAALPTIASVFLVAMVWVARTNRAVPYGFWTLKMALLLCPIALLMPVAGLAITPLADWGSPGGGPAVVFVGTLAIPALALLTAVLTLAAARRGASRWLTTYAGVVSLAMAGIGLYLSRHDMLGVRTWTY